MADAAWVLVSGRLRVTKRVVGPCLDRRPVVDTMAVATATAAEALDEGDDDDDDDKF